jgi:hypothetical protein
MAKRDKRPTKAQLPAGSFRTRLEDGTRVWVIEGRNFESIREYIQYRRDLALIEKLEVKSTAGDKETVVVQPTQADATGETDDGFAGKAVEIQSATGD